MREMRCKECEHRQFNKSSIGGSFKWSNEHKCMVFYNNETNTWDIQKDDVCEKCGGTLVPIKGFDGTNVIANVGKNDPSSPLYWKKGKSNSEIADILANENNNPY